LRSANSSQKSYIQELKREMIQGKSGVDIASLFAETYRGNEMPKITVDNVDYNTEDLTDNGKAQLASLQFLEVQMRKLKNEISVYQTARNSYVAALKAELAKAS